MRKRLISIAIIAIGLMVSFYVSTAKSASLVDGTAISDQWGVNAINLPEARTIQADASDVIIAILDTGIALDHPYLKSHIFTNKNEIPNDGIDNDGNGYTDDVHGWNYIDQNADVSDTLGHGTMVAGVTIAVGKTTIMPVKILDNTDNGVTTDIARGILYAVDNGANIINISSGTITNSVVIAEAVDYAWRKGVLIIAAAGNSNTDKPVFPAGLSRVIAVSSSDQNNDKTVFSNYGDHITISAPGTQILTTSKDPDYISAGGTSLSAAFVSGAAALLLQEKGINSLTPYQIIKAITSSANDTSGYGWDSLFRLRAIRCTKPSFRRYPGTNNNSSGTKKQKRKSFIRRGGIGDVESSTTHYTKIWTGNMSTV